MSLLIKFTDKFRKILELPNYLISGFRYRFNPMITEDINNIRLDQLITASSFFDCETMLLDGNLVWSITAKDDADDDEYECILMYYFDLMKNDFNEVYNISKNKDLINDNLELAGIITPFNEIRRKQNVDIPNHINLGIKPKCSILTRKFNSEESTHIMRTDVKKSDITNPEVTMDKTLLRYKPTESILSDNSISPDRAIDSFKIGSSGLIKIENENSV